MSKGFGNLEGRIVNSLSVVPTSLVRGLFERKVRGGSVKFVESCALVDVIYAKVSLGHILGRSSFSVRLCREDLNQSLYYAND